MKKCPYCGLQNPDEAQQCITCQTALVAPNEPSLPPVMPLEEQRCWERMTFRDFAILLIRLQALWLLVYVVVELTYLPGYLGTFLPARRFEVLPPELKQTFYLAILRILLRVAVAVAAFRYADRLLGWLVRGLVAKRSPNQALQATAAPPRS